MDQTRNDAPPPLSAEQALREMRAWLEKLQQEATRRRVRALTFDLALTHLDALIARVEPSQVGRHISHDEAITLTNANYKRVERLLAQETKRDACGAAVWEEDNDSSVAISDTITDQCLALAGVRVIEVVRCVACPCLCVDGSSEGGCSVDICGLDAECRPMPEGPPRPDAPPDWCRLRRGPVLLRLEGGSYPENGVQIKKESDVGEVHKTSPSEVARIAKEEIAILEQTAEYIEADHADINIIARMECLPREGVIIGNLMALAERKRRALNWPSDAP